MAMVRVRGAALAVVLAVGAACGGGGGGEWSLPAGPAPGQMYSSGQLARFSITDADVPSGYEFVKGESGPQGATCASAGDVETAEDQAMFDKLSALGAQACFKSLFRKKTDDSTEEIAVLAMAFPDEAAAGSALPVLREVFAEASSAEQASDLPAPQLGEQAVPGVKLTGSTPIEGVVYAWRERNVVASVLSFHVISALTDTRVLQIANRVDDRASG